MQRLTETSSKEEVSIFDQFEGGTSAEIEKKTVPESVHSPLR